MRKLKVNAIFFILLFIASCSYQVTGYFHPVAHVPVFYHSELIRGDDTIRRQTVLLYDTLNVDGHRAYYLRRSSDTLDYGNTIIGRNHFLSSAMMFRNDTIYLAPVMWIRDLERLRERDFRHVIPPTLSRSDTLVIEIDNKRQLLHGFKKGSVQVGDQKFRNVLRINITEEWPSSSNFSQVWISREHGVVKWIRPTGMVEELRMENYSKR